MNDFPVASLREEIADLRSYLLGLPGDMQSSEYGRAYDRRLAALLQQLAEEELRDVAERRQSPALAIRLNHGTSQHAVFRGVSAPAQFVGSMLQEWQSLYSALGQAAAGRPTSRGAIPLDIAQQTTLEVFPFAEGSFRIIATIAPSPQLELGDDGSVPVEAFGRFEQLCAAGSDFHKLSTAMAPLKGRVLSSYNRLVRLLGTWDWSIDITLAVSTIDGLRTAGIEAATARDIMPVLERVGDPEEVAESRFVGVLNAASRRTGTFELDLGDDGILPGRAADLRLLAGAVIGRTYEVTVGEVLTSDPFTGATETSWLLKALNPR